MIFLSCLFGKESVPQFYHEKVKVFFFSLLLEQLRVESLYIHVKMDSDCFVPSFANMKTRFPLITLCTLFAFFGGMLASPGAEKAKTATKAPSNVGQTQAEKDQPLISPDLAGSVSLGYGSRYEYRGMTVNTSDSNGGMVMEGEVFYETNKMLSPLLSFTYRDMKVLETEGQTNLFAGVQGVRMETESDTSPVYATKLGYQMINGGLPGVMKGWEKGRDLETDGGTSHELLLNFSSFRPGSVVNFFSHYSAGYGFSGLTGWYLSAAAGIEYPLTEKISATLAANVSWSFNYWTSRSGCDQLNLIFTIPMQVKPDCTFSPFLMTTWGARNAKQINHETRRDLVENFAIVAGARFTFAF